MPSEAKLEKKQQYFDKLTGYFAEYPAVLMVCVDNVGSRQISNLRRMVREDTELLMGKNTLIRKALEEYADKNPVFEKVLPYVKGNVGFVFTKRDVKTMRDVIQEEKIPAAAKVGTYAQCKVVIPAGPTGMEPGMTNFFQALNIQTKIVKAQIEIQQDVTVLEKGQKIGGSEVALLDKLNIKPFSFGIICKHVIEGGDVYSSDVLDISEADLSQKMQDGIANIAALSLGLNYPTAASAPHMVANAFKDLLHMSLGSDYTMKQAEKIKELLNNPEALAAAAAAAAAPVAEAAAAPAKEEKAPEPEEEEEEADMGFGLFD